MIEPTTTIGLGAIAAYLSKDGLQKLLGPTAEYLGEGLRDFTKLRAENIGRIFTKAEQKLGDRLDTPGKVPPRVLRAVINEGSFCDDELISEYFGGVLASSRTEFGRDDRGARIAKILDGLSTYQIRTHYLIYSSIKHIFVNSNLSFSPDKRPKMQIFLPYSGYISAMAYNATEQQQLSQLLGHVFYGLAAENLIDDTFWQYGPKDKIQKFFAEAQGGGIVCTPSALGAELFLWAFGQADKPLEFIFHGSFQNEVAGIPSSVPGVCATK